MGHLNAFVAGLCVPTALLASLNGLYLPAFILAVAAGANGVCALKDWRSR